MEKRTKRTIKIVGGAFAVGTVAALTGGQHYWESKLFGTPPAPVDYSAEAKLAVLRNPSSLKNLGLCALELKDQADAIRAEASQNRAPTDSLSAQVFEVAASLAAANDVSCASPYGPNAAVRVTFDAAPAVDIRADDITTISLG